MGSVEKAARQLFAAQKADGRIPKGHPQRDDLERKQQAYEQDFNATVLNLFDKVLFPIQRAGKPPQLASKPLDMTRDANKPFNGEEQIEKTLTSNPLKLFLWTWRRSSTPSATSPRTCSGPRTRTRRAGPTWPTATPSRPACPGCRPRVSTRSRSIACNRGLWEDLGNGYVTKKPKKKRTSVRRSIAEASRTIRARCACASTPERRPLPRASTTPMDGSAPRDGLAYTVPVTIGDDDVVMRVFASADHLEATAEFRFGPRGKKGVQIDEGKSVYLADLRSGKKLDSRANTFAALADARTAGVTFEQVTLEIGANSRAIRISVGDLTVTPDFIETLLNAALTQFDPAAPVSMIFMNAHFATGHDLKQFADKYRLDIRQEEIRQ
jgi:hypothetical protein